MRYIICIVQIAETKLKYFHAGETKTVAQMLHFRGNNAEVFSKNRKIAAKLFFNGAEKILAWSFDPFSIYSGFFFGRNRPVRFKATEVVDTQIVGQSQLTADTVDPPFISGRLVVIPVIKRVAPKLSGCTEIIRRNSGYAGRIAFGVKLKQLFICPDVCTVKCNKDRNITDDLNAFFMSLVTQIDPLLLEDKLDKLIVTDLFFQFFCIGLFHFVGWI